MLTKLLPDQVSQHWDVIKYAIEESLPPVVGDNPDKMNNILMSILTDKTQCWASYVRDESETRFEGIVLTRILYDDASDTKSLLIYCLYGYEKVDKESWLGGIKALSKFALSRGCVQVVAYTAHDYIVNISKSLGADSAYTFVTFDLKKIVQKLNELG